MKKINIGLRYNVPAGVVQLANRRTGPMVQHFGDCIRHPEMSIELLARSCYLQGVEDAFAAEERRKHSQNTTLSGQAGEK